MKITNKMNLPQAFVSAVNLEPHNAAGHYSATTLNKGAKEIILTNRHFDEIEIDVSDCVWSIWGTEAHSIFEKQKDNNFHEEKFCVSVSNSKVTGQVDSYDLENEIIYDWKTASIWKVKMGDFDDWRKQGLTYAWLLKQSGLNVKKCVFVAILKDHSKSNAAKDSEYPQSPVYTYEFDVTPAELEKHGEWIKAKIAEIEAAEKTLKPLDELATTLKVKSTNGEISKEEYEKAVFELSKEISKAEDKILPCTMAERWADPDKWAVMKNGNKKAIRLHDNEADAEAQAGAMGNSYYVEHRPAISRKCEGYCNVKQWCSFYKATHGGEQ